MLCLANCKEEIFGTNIVVYEATKIYVDGADLLVFNPNQLQLFPGPEFSLSEEEIDEINDTKAVTIEIGICEHCMQHTLDVIVAMSIIPTITSMILHAIVERIFITIKREK